MGTTEIRAIVESESTARLVPLPLGHPGKAGLEEGANDCLWRIPVSHFIGEMRSRLVVVADSLSASQDHRATSAQMFLFVRT